MNPVYMLIEGAVIGFLASIPLGPIGIICIQRTLSGTHRSGFYSGLGAAAADTIFAMLAVFALSFMTSFMDKYDYWFKAIGGILVIALGFSIFYKQIQRPGQQKKVKGTFLSNFFSTFLLTLTNPAYIFVFLTLFAALGINSSGEGNASNAFLVLGVFGGATCWWFLLTYGVDKLRSKFKMRHLWWMNKITGVVIITFGALIILSLVFDLGPVAKILP